MYTIILAIHIVVCVLVILIVLLQSGKGAGISGLFGGGGGDALFSAPSGSMFIRKFTTGLAIAFFMTCLLMTYMAARRGLRTVMRGAWNQPPASAPAAPGQAPVAPPAEKPIGAK
jgi:preprotein translocase subunit SecG